MTSSIDAVTLGVSDPEAAQIFYDKAFGLGDRVRVRESSEPTSGFRGFTLSLTVAGPGTVDNLVEAAVDAGASVLKPVAKSFWGYGGVLAAPDGTIWKVATSAKKDTGPAGKEVESVVLLIGVADVAATKRFYVERGLSVARSFGRKYAEFAGDGPVKFALYARRALAKDAGVPEEGSGSHRIAISGAAGSGIDPDGFVWE